MTNVYQTDESVRQAHGYGRTNSWCALEGKCPAMRRDDTATDGETKPRAACGPGARGIHPIEAFAQVRQVLQRDACSCIFDGHNDSVLHGARRDVDITS